MTMEGRSRWLALYVLCLGDLMIVLDGTIVNVALPSIRDDLGFSQASLAWVVNAYLLTFGGFLLLGGRLGDLYGHRRLFLGGITLFTLASLACGLATSQGHARRARAVQGVGGAVVSAVALSLIMNLFTEPADRAKAMGVFGFVLSGGGDDRRAPRRRPHRPAGAGTGSSSSTSRSGSPSSCSRCALIPGGTGERGTARLDVAGAFLITASLMVAVYAIVKTATSTAWISAHTLGLLGVAAALFATFIVVELRVAAPLMPLGLFRNRNVSAANVTGALMSAGMLALFFFSALYLQQVLGYSPMEVGPRLPALDDPLGPALALRLRPARDAVRDQAAARRRARPHDPRVRALRTRARGRELRRGRPAADDLLRASAPRSRSTRCSSRR